MDAKDSPQNGSGCTTSAKESVVVKLNVPMPPSFKNHKRAIKDSSTGKMRTLTESSVKERMQNLENAILSALYSESQITGSETHSECWKRLRTVLSGLCDDSIREIPMGSWETKYVPKSDEGITIVIETYDAATLP